MQFDQKWFKDEALKRIYKTDEGYWDFSDSLLLWSPGSESAYLDQEAKDTTYGKMISSEDSFINEVASKVTTLLPLKFSFIDLGPGVNFKKQQSFFKAFHNQKKEFIYIPVDINQEMLNRADRFGLENNIVTNPILSEFEKLQTNISQSPYFYILDGLTFQNYIFKVIVEIINELLKNKEDSCFFAVEPREYISRDLKEQYSFSEGTRLYERKINLLGITPNNYELEVTDEVKIWANINNVPENSSMYGKISKGDTVLVAMSIRYNKEEIIQKISQSFTTEIFDNGEFLGFLVKKVE